MPHSVSQLSRMKKRYITPVEREKKMLSDYLQ